VKAPNSNIKILLEEIKALTPTKDNSEKEEEEIKTETMQNEPNF
jgi:hypothetical protein